MKSNCYATNKINSSAIVIHALIFLFAATGCFDSKSPTENVVESGIIYRFPLATGKKWIYLFTQYYEIKDSASIGNKSSFSNKQDTVEWKIIDSSIVSGIVMWRLQTTIRHGKELDSSEAIYFHKQGVGLMRLGLPSDNVGIPLLKSAVDAESLVVVVPEKPDTLVQASGNASEGFLQKKTEIQIENGDSVFQVTTYFGNRILATSRFTREGLLGSARSPDTLIESPNRMIVTYDSLALLP